MLTMVWLWLLLSLVVKTSSVGTTLKGVTLARHGDSAVEPYIVLGPLPVLATPFTSTGSTGFRVYSGADTYFGSTASKVGLKLQLLPFADSSLTSPPSETGPYVCDTIGSVVSTAADWLDTDTRCTGLKYLTTSHYMFVKLEAVFPASGGGADITLEYETRDCTNLPLQGTAPSTVSNPVYYGNCGPNGLGTSTTTLCTEYFKTNPGCAAPCLPSMSMCLPLIVIPFTSFDDDLRCLTEYQGFSFCTNNYHSKVCYFSEHRFAVIICHVQR